MMTVLSKFRLRIFSFLLLSFFCLQAKAGIHFTESFTSPNFPTSSWTNGTFTLSSGNWDVEYAMGLDATNAYNSSGGAVKINRYLESYITTPEVNSVGTVSFYYRNFSTVLGGGTVKVQKSINNGAFTDITTIDFTSVATYTFCSVTVNDASSNIKIRIYCPYSNSSFLCVDEIMITDMGQTLAANPSSLEGVDYYFGSGPSVAQIFNLSGSNLTGAPGNIAVTAPADYEVSLDNSSFSTNINVPYTSATLSPVPVYVRLKAGLAIGTYNSELISVSGGGAATFDVPCSGSVTAAPPSTLNANPATLSGFTYSFGAGPSVAQSYQISGTDLTGYPGNIVATAPADYELSLDYSNYYSSVNIPFTGATLASVVVYVRLKAGLAVNTYNSEIITNIGGGASSADVTCNGSVSAAPSPTLLASPNPLSGFTYVFGSGPSTTQSYNLSGSNLTGYPSNITVTAPANYEVSLTSGSGYASSVNVPYSGPTFSTNLYVRLRAGLAVGSYNSEIITNAGGGATTEEVTCSGSVTAAPSPLLSTNQTALTGFTYIIGSGPSAEQSYNLSGSSLTGYPSNITVTAPTDYEISLSSGSGFTSSVNVPYSSATLASTLIYVRLKAGLSIASYNSELIANAGGGATTVNVSCSGSVTDVPLPSLSVTQSSLTGFNYTVGSGPSTEQSYSLSGSALTGYPSNITVSAPTDYEISLTSGSGFTSSVNIPYTSATLASTLIYVRLKSGLTIASYNSEIISNAGGGATTVNVTCSGSVTDVSTTCGSETFTNIPTNSSNTYLARTWTGDDGNTWNATTARTDQTLTGKAICFKGYAESPITPNGIGDITVTTKFPFSDGTYDLPVFVNGVQVGTVPVSATVTTTTITGINIEGNVQIKFESNGTKRPVIDDLTWTCYVFTDIVDVKSNYFNLLLYPNPATDFVSCTVNSSFATEAEVELYNLFGQLIMKRSVNLDEGSTIFSLDVSTLSGGVYYLTLRNSSGSYFERKQLVVE
ncbi:MAG: T9SS type A sorting domain-containing protein [Bacteroidota bacterium]